MPNSSGRIVTVFIVGAIVGGLAIYLLNRPSKVEITPTPTRTLSPVCDGSGDLTIIVQSSAPGVNCQGVVLHVGTNGQVDHVTWKPDGAVQHFKVDFKGEKPFTKNNNDKGEFTEASGDSDGTVKDPCPGQSYCISYYKYDITIDNDPNKKYDPGVIITKP